MFKTKNNIALFIALLFHVSGALGILFSPYKDWFVQHTSLNLLLMAALLMFTQPQKNSWFFLFFMLAFATGMITEIVGVNTGELFGSYQYGNLMGAKYKGVPWLIGLQWFVTVFCSGIIMEKIHQWTIKKTAAVTATKLPSWVKGISLIVDGALMAVFFDYVMEPVAVKLGFWQWTNHEIPFYNYVCWFVISAGLLAVFRILKFNKTNHFAVHLFIIQLLFFLALRTVL
ncbi:MAG: carotenoid biosynthesis protein [Chitinophagaceae bacterium]|nr:carotenoid biosynthesis protein [Chitinophagaceae bacterium]